MSKKLKWKKIKAHNTVLHECGPWRIRQFSDWRDCQLILTFTDRRIGEQSFAILFMVPLKTAKAFCQRATDAIKDAK